MAQLADFIEEAKRLHHHLCPRQVIGMRMGMLAAELLNLQLPQDDKRLFTFVETDGCFADGVAVATGCSLGHRTLRLIDHGKPAATFIDTETDHAVRIFPHPASRQAARDLLPQVDGHWQAMLEAYQLLPADALLSWYPVSLTIDLKALISKHGPRVNCAACGEEIINEREVIVDGRTLCRACAGDSYFTRQPEAVLQTQR
ncbi:MAG: TraR/DksA C4-type zinc finger protein [Anaerolineae bacterium]|nr:TraR/DksA C4-type zinc finger protein [Anaerolineae bacterium]